ncbi:MAG: UvrD-helicase domain-containing protein, partial [bacterium]
MKETLNTEQMAIVKKDGNIFVKAGAGTGKTRTITELYFDLLFQKQHDVRNILAITFTEKAANEMKDRIKKRIKEFTDGYTGRQKRHLLQLQKRMNYAWISTLHAFCSRILREFPLQSGVDPMFEIIDEAEKKSRINYTIKNYFNQTGGSSKFRMIKELAFLYRYDNLLDLFQEALVKNQYPLSKVNPSLFQTNTDDVKTGVLIRRLLPGFQTAFQEMVLNYHQNNKRDNKLDYEGLLFEVKRLLKKDRELKETLQNRFKCIIVDEFQDTNQQQKEIVDLLTREETKVVYVGDPKQSIYYFNGADVSVFNQTEDEFRNEETYELFKNYRSNSELIDFFNLIFPKIFVKKSELPYTITYDALSAEKKDKTNEPVKLLPIATSFEEECENICQYIKKRNAEGKDFKAFAIL